MTAVAQEMLELADQIEKYGTRNRDIVLTDEAERLIVIALRESALSRNEVVGERMI